jgi:Transposase DDE domain group 1
VLDALAVFGLRQHDEVALQRPADQHLGWRASQALSYADHLPVAEMAAGAQWAVGLKRHATPLARFQQRAAKLEGAELDLVDDRWHVGDLEHGLHVGHAEVRDSDRARVAAFAGALQPFPRPRRPALRPVNDVEVDGLEAEALEAADVSLTTGTTPSVNAAITHIPHTAWTAIHYPQAFVDEQTGELVSDAEVAEIPYTAFTSRPHHQATSRLIVRRVKRLNPKAAPGQDGLFTLWRHHAVFVTSPFQMRQAESQHRGHAIIEQVIADAAASALAHLPSGSFHANAAWTVLWAIAHNLTRATGALAGTFHARAHTATIRTHLINVPARLARSARRLTLHLPELWPWQPAWQTLHAAVHRPPQQHAI